MVIKMTNESSSFAANIIQQDKTKVIEALDVVNILIKLDITEDSIDSYLDICRILSTVTIKGRDIDSK